MLCLLSLAACSLPGTTRPTVKIGLVGPFAGWHRARGYDALWAARVAVQELNENGGPAGYLVELVSLDDHLDPQLSARRAKELVVDPAVMGVVGCLSPATASAARGAYSSAGLPLITLASVEAKDDNVFVIAPAPHALVQGALGHIRGSGSRSHRTDSPALLRGSESETWLGTAQAQKDAAASVELGEVGWLEALAELRPDWVICTVQAQLAGQGLQRARNAGVRASFVGGPDWQTEMFRNVVGEASRGTWFATGVPRREDLQGAQSFLRAYRELSGHEPGPDAILAYDATVLLLAALEEAIEREGYPSRQGIREALSEVWLGGITGPILFDRLGARMDASVWVYYAE